jgi:hypothetical protein
MWWIAVA